MRAKQTEQAINRPDQAVEISSYKECYMLSAEQAAANGARLKALWQTQGFQASVEQGREKARATRRVKAEIRQTKKTAELQARREARESRRNEREKDRRFKREKREAKQAARIARLNSPIPRIELTQGNEDIPSWNVTRNDRVTVLENGQIVKRSWAEIGER